MSPTYYLPTPASHTGSHTLATVAALILLSTGIVSAQITDAATLLNAVNNGANNATVLVGAGTFVLSEQLKPKPGMTIQGAGAGLTILEPATTWVPSTIKLPDNGTSASSIEPTAYLFNLGTADGVTIANLTLRGKAQLHGGVYGNDADNLELADLDFENFLWSGVRTFGMDGSTIRDCNFIDAGGKWSNGSPGVSGGVVGGGIYVSYVKTSEFYNNRFWRTLTAPERSFFGIKGRQAKFTRIHHNTIDVNFSIEFPFENDDSVEIDHNYFAGAVSIPKHGGGAVPPSGWTFWLHHNWFTKSYSIEFARNGCEISNNLFDFSTTDDGGHLITDHGSASVIGPVAFHNNLVKNPGRGVFNSGAAISNYEFANNHILANTTITPRTSGLFGFNTGSSFSTLSIRDNIIECIGVTRPLLRNTASNAAQIANNTLINVGGTGYSNPDTGAPRGLLAPLYFTCGVDDEFTVDGWNGFLTPVGLLPEADSYVRKGYTTNYGSDPELLVKDGPTNPDDHMSYIRFEVGSMTSNATQVLLVLTVTGLGNESSPNRTITLKKVNNDNWSETTITWGNKPAVGNNSNILGTFIVVPGNVGGEITIDVTNFVNEQRSLDGKASFALLQPSNANGLVKFGSRESTTPPRLEID